MYLQNNREIDKCVNIPSCKEQLESKHTHTVTQPCCDALFCENEVGSLNFVAKMLQLAKDVYGLINVGIRTELFMKLPVAITLLLGSIPNSVHFQLQSGVKFECCASLINKDFQISCKIYTECKVLLTEASCKMYIH